MRDPAEIFDERDELEALVAEQRERIAELEEVVGRQDTTLQEAHAVALDAANAAHDLGVVVINLAKLLEKW